MLANLGHTGSDALSNAPSISDKCCLNMLATPSIT